MNSQLFIVNCQLEKSKIFPILNLPKLLQVCCLYLYQVLVACLADELQCHFLVDAEVVFQSLDESVLRDNGFLSFLEGHVDDLFELFYVLMQSSAVEILVEHEAEADSENNDGNDN